MRLDSSSGMEMVKMQQRPVAGCGWLSPLRWVFQCFIAVHLVVFQGVQQVVNLTDDRLHILRFFSPACRRYYLLSDPAS